MSQSKPSARTQFQTGASEPTHASGSGHFKSRQPSTDFNQHRLASALSPEQPLGGPNVMRLEDVMTAQCQSQQRPGGEGLRQQAGSWLRQGMQSLRQQRTGDSLTAADALSQNSGPLVGIIDTGFAPGQHGHAMLQTIQAGNPNATILLADGVGTGNWPDSLTQFVDTAKAAGKSQAVVNLSFDLTQQNPDGSITTRQELTAQEQSALAYAQQNGVLVVASAGNEGGAMSALGQASQLSDNLIVVGAAEGNQRAAYSSYGEGLDFLVSLGQKGGSGTSQAAAEMTKTISEMWAVNPELSSRQVVQVLEATSKDIGASGWDPNNGMGIANREGSLRSARETAAESPGAAADHFTQMTESALANPDGLGGETWNGPEGAIASERANFKGIGSAIGRVARRAGNVAGSTSRRTGNSLGRRRLRPKRSSEGRISSFGPKRGNRSSSRSSLRPSSARSSRARKPSRSNQSRSTARRKPAASPIPRKPQGGYSKGPRTPSPLNNRRSNGNGSVKKPRIKIPFERLGGSSIVSRIASGGLGLLGQRVGRRVADRTAARDRNNRPPGRRLRNLTQIGMLPGATRPTFQGRRGNPIRIASAGLGVLGRQAGRQLGNRISGRGGDRRPRRLPDLTRIGMLPGVIKQGNHGGPSRFTSAREGAQGRRQNMSLSTRRNLGANGINTPRSFNLSILNNPVFNGINHLARGTGALPLGLEIAKFATNGVETMQRTRLAGDIRRQVRRSMSDLDTVNNVFSTLERGRGRNISEIARDFRGPSLGETLRQRSVTSFLEGRRVRRALEDISRLRDRDGKGIGRASKILGDARGRGGKTIGIFGSFLRPTTVVSGVKYNRGPVFTVRDVGRVLGFKPAPKPAPDRQTLPYGARFHETHAEQRRIFGSGALGRARRELFGATQGVARRFPVSRAGRIANRLSGRLLRGGRSGAVSQSMCQIKGGCGEFHRLKSQASGRFDALATGIRGRLGGPASVSLFSPDRTVRSIAPNISSKDLRRVSRGIADDFRRSTPGATRRVSEGLRRVPVRGILGGARKAGPVGLVIGAGMDVYDLHQAHEKDGGFGSNFGVTASRVAGGWGGAAAGAAIGAAIGAPFAGVGAVPGAAIGAAIGGTVGSIGGSRVGEEIGEEVFE